MIYYKQSNTFQQRVTKDIYHVDPSQILSLTKTILRIQNQLWTSLRLWTSQHYFFKLKRMSVKCKVLSLLFAFIDPFVIYPQGLEEGQVHIHFQLCISFSPINSTMKHIALLITCALIVTVMPCKSAQIVSHSGNYLFTTLFIH